jgi:hypothetical protein
MITSQGGVTVKAIARIAVALLCAGTAAASVTPAATILVSSDIVSSETWFSKNEYELDKPIYVTNGATLTIEPGTVVRGQPTSGANDPGALIITRGSKIRAMGTGLKPIVFTNLDDDNIGTNPGTPPYDTASNAIGTTGTWGGVILLGRSYVANNTLSGPDPAREFQIEGLVASAEGKYGNCAGDPLVFPNCDDDDSGTMEYVSIRYGGFLIGPNNEINGLTLGAVGRGTDLRYIEVLNNKDDGVECFGGTVDIKYLVVANSGDDSIDWDEGYRGRIQFLLAMQGTPGADRSDKGGELDGGNSPDGSQPMSIPTVYNATWVGLGGTKAYTNSLQNTALHFRDNSGGRIYNSFLGDFGGATMLIEGTTASATGPISSGERAITPYVIDGAFYRGPASAFQLELEDNDFWCFGNGSTVPTGTGASIYGGAPADDTKIMDNNGAFTNLALDDDYYACGSALPIRALVRGAGAVTDPDPVTAVDPRPAAGSTLLTTNRVPPNDGFFEAAPYKGAFGTRRNWAEGWTAASRLGYFPAPTQVPISGDVNSEITTSQTWTSDNEYVLTRPVYLTNGATLTIEAGTVVRGEPNGGANDPGALIVARGAKVQAVGTKDAPIVFTNLDDDNIGNSPGTSPYDTLSNAIGTTGTWGGVILLGRTYVANNTLSGPDPAREFQIEGLVASTDGRYGNCAGDPLVFPNCDDDDSGRMEYVSIRYGGFNLSANNEINGLTLGAVGRSTDLRYIEVLNGKDDGVEFFGGTVDLKNLIVVNSGDDSIDWDEGYRGNLQYALLLQGTPGSDKSDKGGELDGGNGPDGSQPMSIPTVANVTWVGLGGTKAYTNSLQNTALHFRDNSGGRLYNSSLNDFGGATMLIEGTTASATGPISSGERSITPYVIDGSFYRGPASAFQLELQDNEFWCFGNGSTVPTGTGASIYGGAPADDTKIMDDNGAFTNLALDDDYHACASAAPIRILVRGSAAGTDPDPITAVDPRPASGSTLLATDRPWVGSSAFEPAPYKGAFQGSNWAASWSATSRLGYFPACDSVSFPAAVPDEVPSLSLSSSSAIAWTTPMLTGNMGVQVYDVLRSTSASSFGAATCVVSDGAEATASDSATPASRQVFFYLVRAENDCAGGTLGFSYNTLPVPAPPPAVERAGVACEP